MRPPRHFIASDTETDDRVNDALVGIAGRLYREFVGRRSINGETAKRLDKMLEDMVDEVRSKGVDFPPLVAVYMVRFRSVDVVRADLDRSGVRDLIRRLIVKYGQTGTPAQLVASDIASGISRAFPWYRGDDI